MEESSIYIKIHHFVSCGRKFNIYKDTSIVSLQIGIRDITWATLKSNYHGQESGGKNRSSGTRTSTTADHGRKLQRLNEKYEWLTQPKEVFGNQKNLTSKKWEVLISWKGLPPHEATWEDCKDFKQ